MSAGKARRFTVPPATDLHRDDVIALMGLLGYDAKSSVTAIRIHPRHVEVDLRPKGDVKVTVRHAVIGPEVEDA